MASFFRVRGRPVVPSRKTHVLVSLRLRPAAAELQRAQRPPERKTPSRVCPPLSLLRVAAEGWVSAAPGGLLLLSGEMVLRQSFLQRQTTYEHRDHRPCGPREDHTYLCHYERSSSLTDHSTCLLSASP